MEPPSSPLQYPKGYPPTNGWNRFFLGVRWLGPDTSFFKQLKSQQAGRIAEQMECWGGGLRQVIAEKISERLAKYLKWRSKFFLPDDCLEVVCHGPSVESYDTDFALEDATNDTITELDLTLPESFWSKNAPDTFGQFIDLILNSTSAKS